MIKVQPPYHQLYTDKEHFIILITGGRGSAKSFNASTFVQRLSFQGGHKMLYSRYTMTSAGVSVIPEFREKIELDGMINKFIVTQTDIINKFSGSEILFRGIKTSSGNQTANLKSIQGLTTFIGDEMEEWQSEEEFDTLRLSIRKKGIQNRVILIMNPSNADHFVYKKYIQDTHKIVKIDGVEVQISTHPDVLHIHTSYLDNIDNLAPQFLQEVAELKAKAIKEATRPDGSFDQAIFNKSKYAYKIIGRWADIAEGVIFTDVEEGEFDTSLPYCYAQDYGFSVDPTTLVKVAVDKKRKRVYVKEEYYSSTPLGTNGVYEVNKSRIERPEDLIVGDSAEDRLISDLAAMGLNIIECEKGPGSVTAGISALQDYTIVVTPDSPNVKRELRTYCWNDKKAGIPMDANNHTIDPIRYGFRQLSGELPNYQSDLTALGIF
ncbi:MAG TPA: phage terminase large subunit [Sphingobacteriaceae bacterium]